MPNGYHYSEKPSKPTPCYFCKQEDTKGIGVFRFAVAFPFALSVLVGLGVYFATRDSVLAFALYGLLFLGSAWWLTVKSRRE